MAAARYSAAAPSCFNCQHRALNVFASLAGLSIRPRPILYTPRNRRAIANTFQYRSEKPLNESTVSWHAEKVGQSVPSDHLTENTTSDTLRASEGSPLPWYLQVQPSGQTTSPLAERQKLPDLPADSPANLLPMLEHLSVNIGLDDLTLLDLRKLDPPPALGANLIMVFGTARSEKHLHVSADRFCRWLRTNYKLSPFADGLLGRNELKLKLRRKAKRAKLLGSARTSKTTEEDDGIRTAWVCVNVGSIDKDGGGVERSLDDEGIIGFGGLNDGSRLVVQMLTEEKREGLDLENLWGGFLRRQSKKEMKAMEKSQKELQADFLKSGEVGPSTKAPMPLVADTSSFVISSPRPTITPLILQRNLYSQIKQFSTRDPSLGNRRPAIMSSPNSSARILGLRSAGFRFSESSTALSTDSNIHLKDLRKYLESLKKMRHIDAIKALGTGPEDRGSTPFLSSFYGLIPLFPKVQHWGARFELLFLAIEIGHPKYTVSCLIELLHEMQESLITVPISMLERIIDMLAHSNSISKANASEKAPQFSVMMGILEEMSLRGAFFLTPAITENLLIGVIKARRFSNGLRSPKTAFRSLLNFIQARQAFFTDVSRHVQIMQELALADDWDDYWHYWRGFPRSLQRRTPDLYAGMFRHLAESSHQARCVEALSTWVPEMSMERPPVMISGNLARSIMRCLLVADPMVEQEAHLGTNEKGQWVRLWRRCQKGLGEPSESFQTKSDVPIGNVYTQNHIGILN